MRKIIDEEKQTLLGEAAAILTHRLPPSEMMESRTGLVVGYVQSGKTASYTTVAALARDNSYRLVIVITGISTSLLGQSNSRLSADLQLETRDDRKWKPIQNPSLRGRSKATTRVTTEELQDTIDIWNDPLAADGQRQALLVTVMKNHRHLRNLTELLTKLDLRGVPTLVIDDEADQAGLNTKVNQNDHSATYSHILELRSALPAHTYLQYTATPQAPLLISIADVLSPDFVRVLTPGSDYVGGQAFFVDRPELTRVIPVADIASQNNSLTAPPDSLLKALRLFFLGIAAGIVCDDSKGNRSMLVHPSQGTLHHRLYLDWIRAVRQAWIAILQTPDSDRDRSQLVDDFAEAYRDLEATSAEGLPEFTTLLARLPLAMKATIEVEVNASGRGHTPEIKWRNSYSHILVGGQAMDRGFTVEGLTVTYMPRGTGIGNADTIQQRARFFGYKKHYLGYCRVFLEDDTLLAFRSYVRHELYMRRELELQAQSERPLSEWKRRFLLDPALKTTRNEVISLPNMRFNFVTEIFRPRVIYDTQDNRVANRSLVSRFEASLLLDVGGNSGDDTHLIAQDVRLTSVIEQLLSDYRVGDPGDSWRLTALVIQLQNIVDKDANALCTVYIMGRGRDRTFQRRRGVNTDSQTLNTYLFQGANPSGYAGDVNLPTAPNNRVQIQLHHLSLRDGTVDGPEVASDVCILAAKIIPDSDNDDVVVQTA